MKHKMYLYNVPIFCLDYGYRLLKHVMRIVLLKKKCTPVTQNHIVPYENGKYMHFKVCLSMLMILDN